MRPKGMGDLAAFSAREVKRVAAEERERDEYSIQTDSESQSKKQSHPSELFENKKRGNACWGERSEREGQMRELVGDQNPSSEAPPKSQKRRERREQRKCQGRSDGAG